MAQFLRTRPPEIGIKRPPWSVAIGGKQEMNRDEEVPAICDVQNSCECFLTLNPGTTESTDRN